MPYKYIASDKLSTTPIARRVVFVTEGQDDALFLEQILESRGEDEAEIEIRFTQGVGNIPAFIRALVKEPALTRRKVDRVCVIVDADDNFAGAAAKLARALLDAQLPVPDVGSFAEDGALRVGTYIFPRHGTNGMLEDLILGSIPNDIRKEVATAAISQIHSITPLDKVGKRTVQVFLALSAGEICKGPGQGIRNGAVPFDLSWYPELNRFLDEFLAF